MKNLIRLTLAAAFLFASAAPALACENCANCPKHSAAKATTAENQAAPGDKKPGAEKPKCECTKGKDCACAKAGKPCKCAEQKPKEA